MILTNQLATEFVYQDGLMIVRNHTPEIGETESSDGYLDELGGERNWIGRARYATVCTGHLGLRLEHYGHWTSPIRRYADLANQRILLNLIDGLPCPYSESELEEIARHLNTEGDKLRRRLFNRNVRAEYLRMARAKYHSLIEMSDENFSLFLHCLATEIFNLTDARIRAIRTRYEQSRLSDRDVALLVLNPCMNRVWVQLKSVIINGTLKGDRRNGIEILRSWPDAGGPAESELIWNRSTNRHRHRAKVSAPLNGKTYHSGSFEASTAADAEHIAACGLMAKYNGIPHDTVLPEPPKIVNRKNDIEPFRLLEKPPLDSPLSLDAKQRLHALAERHRVPHPEFVFSENADTQPTSFACIARFAIDGNEYSSAPCAQPNKKLAAAEASWDLLARLPPEVSRMKEPRALDDRLTGETGGVA